MLRDRIHELRDEIERIAHEHGAVRIRLFGSVVRGEERDDSDVDFLILPGEGFSLLDHVRLKHALEDLLGRPVDLISERSLGERVSKYVLHEVAAL